MTNSYADVEYVALRQQQAYCTTHLFLDEVKPIKKYIIVKIYEVKNKQTMSVTRTCKCYNSCKNMNI